MADEHDTRLNHALRAALDASADELPAAVTSRLAQARRAAIARLVTRVAWVPPRWLPALAYAATIVMAIGAWNYVSLPPLPMYDGVFEAAAAEDAELLQELEFIAWLTEQEDALAADEQAG